MKGIVFTEFLEFVEHHHGIVMVDKLIINSVLDSGGVYSAIGTYDHSEMVQLVSALSKETNTPIEKLLLAYGEHFFSILLRSYPNFFEGVKDCFDFLSSVDSYIHPEVLKLYPDAKLPEFSIQFRDTNKLQLIYYSERALHAFAEGLMRGAMGHYTAGDFEVTKELLDPDGTKVCFTVTR